VRADEDDCARNVAFSAKGVEQLFGLVLTAYHRESPRERKELTMTESRPQTALNKSFSTIPLMFAYRVSGRSAVA
jgi:hypothetical protein